MGEPGTGGVEVETRRRIGLAAVVMFVPLVYFLLPLRVAPKPRWLVAPLHRAVELGSREGVDWLLSLGCDADGASEAYGGDRPIDVALRGRREELLLLLLEKGAAPGRGGVPGPSPLGLAVKGGLPAAWKALRRKGARLDEEDLCHLLDDGRALTVALGFGECLQAEMLGTALRNASRRGLLLAVRTLCLVGAALDETGGDGMGGEGVTALHLAVEHDRFEIFRLLLHEGARVDRRDGKGRNVIDLARELRREDMLRFAELR